MIHGGERILRALFKYWMMQCINDSKTEKNSTNGRWTYKRIPSICEWTKTNHEQVNFYLTELLIGLGCYRAYFYK